MRRMGSSSGIHKARRILVISRRGFSAGMSISHSLPSSFSAIVWSLIPSLRPPYSEATVYAIVCLFVDGLTALVAGRAMVWRRTWTINRRIPKAWFFLRLALYASSEDAFRGWFRSWLRSLSTGRKALVLVMFPCSPKAEVTVTTCNVPRALVNHAGEWITIMGLHEVPYLQKITTPSILLRSCWNWNGRSMV